MKVNKGFDKNACMHGSAINFLAMNCKNWRDNYFRNVDIKLQ